MANDIVNATDGATTGLQRQGRVTVASGGRGSNFSKTYDPTLESLTSPVVDIAAKYDARFDDPRYYTGDAIT